MAKELFGAVYKDGKIDATYRIEVLGEKSVKTKSDFSDAVQAAAAELLTLCDNLTPEIGDIIGFQTYTKITDFTNNGNTIDIFMRDNQSHRVMNPPANIKELSQAFEDALQAEL